MLIYGEYGIGINMLVISKKITPVALTASDSCIKIAQNGATPLMIGIQHADKVVVGHLLNHKADVEEKNKVKRVLQRVQLIYNI